MEVDRTSTLYADNRAYVSKDASSDRDSSNIESKGF
jgi:hypothetical protein